MVTILLLIIFLLSLVYFFLKTSYEYWEKRGVPGPKPTFLVGNMGSSVTMKKPVLEIYGEIYNKYKQYPIVGIYKMTSPILLVCDPEVIKDMTVKSFQHFHDNDFEADKKVDPLLGRNPFFLRGEEWKTVRSQLTPGFTSGKMKWVYPLLENTSKQMNIFIKSQPKSTEGQDVKKLCSKFTLDNVASCAFGLEAKAFTKETTELQEIVNSIFQTGPIETLFFTLMFFIPPLAKILRIKFVRKEVEDKIIAMVTETLKYREDNSIIRNDFLHILGQLKKTCKEYEFTDIDVAAHASGFIFDGTETSATVMSFALYELAANPDVQSQLREEINENFGKDDQNLSYDVLQGMPYLDAVISETLRIHPPISVLAKKCTKSYVYRPKKGDGINKPVEIEEGTSIAFPVLGLQMDPDYFEDPEIFNPERFIGANKDNIVKYTFMPFGEGPRACLGQRFGLLQIKVGLAYIIKNFKLTVNKKTKEPLEYDPFSFITAAKGGLWVDFEKLE